MKRKYFGELYDCEGQYITCFVFESERDGIPAIMEQRMRKSAAFRGVAKDGTRFYTVAETVLEGGEYVTRGGE